MMLRFLIAFFFFSSLCTSLCSQGIAIDLLQGKNKITLPFKYQNGYMLVDLKVSKFLSLKCVFDTGAQNNIIFDKLYMDASGIKHQEKIELYGSDLETPVNAYICRNVPLSISEGHTVLRDLIVLDDQTESIGQLIGTNIDGILGANFFKGLAVEINYQKEKIILHHPLKYKKPGKDYKEMDMEIKLNKPYLKGFVNQGDYSKVDLTLLLDTGAPLALMLHSNTHTALSPPQNAINGVLAFGLGGAINGFTGKVDQLKINDYNFYDLYTNFQDIDSTVVLKKSTFRNGMIGNSILSQFHIYIDYLNEKAYFKPNKNYGKQLQYDKSGMTIFALGKRFNQYYVKHVQKGSPAEEAGIKEGDIIKKIGWWSTRWYSLERIINKFKGDPGKTIKLKLARDGKKYSTKLTLKDPYSQSIYIDQLINNELKLYSIK